MSQQSFSAVLGEYIDPRCRIPEDHTRHRYKNNRINSVLAAGPHILQERVAAYWQRTRANGRAMHALCSSVLGLGLLVLLAACGTRGTGVSDAPLTSIAGLRPLTDTRVSRVWVHPGRDLSRYSRVLVRPIRLVFPDAQMRDVQGSALRDIASYCHGAVVDAIADRYAIAPYPSADTLILEPYITGLDKGGGLINAASIALAKISIDVGSIGMEAVLRDGATNTVLVVAQDRRQGRRVLNAKGVLDSWADVKSACREWGQLFRERLDASR